MLSWRGAPRPHDEMRTQILAPCLERALTPTAKHFKKSDFPLHYHTIWHMSYTEAFFAVIE